MEKSTILALSLLVSSLSPAFALDDEIKNHPNSSVVSFYKENQAEIDQLRSVISSSAISGQRKSALADLANKYPLAAEITSRKLVSDQQTEIAVLAIQVLKLNTVMSDHNMSESADDLSPAVSYTMQQHMLSRKALRAGITDEREEIRSETAPFLASLSDTPSLDAIVGATGKLYTDIQAANIFTLASGDTGAKYVSRYLGAGSPEAQRTAIGYLGAIPQYQNQIRAAYFLNPEAPTEFRTASADVLSTYDGDFPEYALAAATAENASQPEFIAAMIKGYVTSKDLKGTIVQPDIARALSSKLSTTVKSLNPDQIDPVFGKDLKSLQNKLNTLGGQFK